MMIIDGSNYNDDNDSHDDHHHDSDYDCDYYNEKGSDYLNDDL